MLRYTRLIASPVTGSDAGHVHEQNLREHPEHYGRNLRLRLIVDLLLPGRVLQAASRARSIMRREWLKLLAPYEVLIAPTLMFTLKKIHYADPITERDQARGRFGTGTGDVTIVAAFLGTPAMTVPLRLRLQRRAHRPDVYGRSLRGRRASSTSAKPSSRPRTGTSAAQIYRAIAYGDPTTTVIPRHRSFSRARGNPSSFLPHMTI